MYINSCVSAYFYRNCSQLYHLVFLHFELQYLCSRQLSLATEVGFRSLKCPNYHFFWDLGCFLCLWCFHMNTNLKKKKQHPCCFEWDMVSECILPSVSWWAGQNRQGRLRHRPKHLNSLSLRFCRRLPSFFRIRFWFEHVWLNYCRHVRNFHT